MANFTYFTFHEIGETIGLTKHFTYFVLFGIGETDA